MTETMRRMKTMQHVTPIMAPFVVFRLSRNLVFLFSVKKKKTDVFWLLFKSKNCI